MPNGTADTSPDPLSNPTNAISAVAPIISQITGGNPAASDAGRDAAGKASNGFFGDISAAVQKAASQIDAAFNAGKAAGSSPAAIAQTTANLSQQQSQATMAAGQGGAEVVLNDAMQKAKAANATAADAVRLGLDPNNPAAIAGMKAVSDSAASVFSNVNKINEMKKTDFFDNPGQYLIDRIINIPIAQGRAAEYLDETKEAAGAIGAQTQALGFRSQVDTALNSVDTVQRAAGLYKQALASATAAGIDPLIKSQQISISAYDLGVGQENAATSRGHLALAQQMQPLQMDEAKQRIELSKLEQQRVDLENQQSRAKNSLEVQALKQQIESNKQQYELTKAKAPLEMKKLTSETGYYDTYKQSQIEELASRVKLRAQEETDKIAKGKQTEDQLSAINNLYHYFGSASPINDISELNRYSKDAQAAQFEMAGNLSAFKQIAATPAAALDLIRRSGIPMNNIPDSHLPTLQSLSDTYSSVVEKAVDPTRPGGALKGDALKDAVYSGVQQIVRSQQDNITSSNRFFQMPSMNTVVGLPELKDNPIIQALRPLTLDGSGQQVRRELDGSALINTAASLVESKKLTESQAVDALKDAGHTILNSIQSAGGYQRFAIPVEQKFPVTFKKAGTGFLTSNVKVDLMNSADTLQKLRIQRAAIKNINSGGESITEFSPQERSAIDLFGSKK